MKLLVPQLTVPPLLHVDILRQTGRRLCFVGYSFGTFHFCLSSSLGFFRKPSSRPRCPETFPFPLDPRTLPTPSSWPWKSQGGARILLQT